MNNKPLNVITTGSVDLIHLFLKGRNRQTFVAYKADLTEFQKFLSVTSVAEFISCFFTQGNGRANQIAFSFRAHLVNSGLQPTTINRKLAAVRSLVKFARTIGVVTWELEVPNLKAEPYRDTVGPGKINFEKVFRQTALRNDKKSVRDRAILRLLYDLALRASEIVGTNVEDIDLNLSTLAVLRKGKTQKVKLTLPEITLYELKNWLKIRKTFNVPTSALFLSMDRSNKGQSKRLTRGGLYDLVSLLGKRVDVAIRPHGVRHTSITEAIKVAKSNGLGLDDVLEFSSHINVATLMIYNDRLENKQGKIASLVAKELDLDSTRRAEAGE